jgi:DNA-binding NarL/FixJ family response regulator
VTSAETLERARALLLTTSFDVVVCDVMMPDGGGEALYSKLRAARSNMAQRMLFLTGGVSASHARDFLATQPQPVLTKPLELARLLKAVAELGPPRGGRIRSEPPIVAFGAAGLGSE